MALEDLKKAQLVDLIGLERQRVARLEQALRHVRAQRVKNLLDEVADLERDKTDLEDENEDLRRDLVRTEDALAESEDAHEHHALCNAYRKDRPGDCICPNFN